MRNNRITYAPSATYLRSAFEAAADLLAATHPDITRDDLLDMLAEQAFMDAPTDVWPDLGPRR